MKHYLNSQGQLFAFEADGSQDFLITADMKPATDAEVAAIQRPPLSFEDLRGNKIAAINEAAEKCAAQLTAGYPDFETKTWPDQQAEAIAWDADSAVATPRIDAMARYRGIDRLEYLNRTLAKVLYFQKASDYLVGTRQKYVDQANAAKTADALDKVVPVFTLPAP